MTIPYNPDIPLRKDPLAKSQGDFLNNFTQLYNAFTNNHVALDATNAGNHTIVQMLEQDKNDQFQTNVDQISVYCKNVEGQTDQIFLRYQGNQQEFQYSTYQIYSLPQTTGSTRFFTFLPGNVIAFFGTQNVRLSQQAYPIALIPQVAKNIITVNLCPVGTTPNLNPYVTIPTKFQKIITSINLTLNPGNIFFKPTNLFFFVLANI